MSNLTAALHSLHQFGAEMTQADEDGRPLNPNDAHDTWIELRAEALEAGATRDDVARVFAAGMAWEPFTD